MKWVRTAIGAVIAISVIPAIILTVINVTELKDVKNVQFELLSEEDGNFFITTGTYDKLIENKNIINYDIESNYVLITHEELDRGTWRINNELYNEIIDRESNPRIIMNVLKVNLWEYERIFINEEDENIYWYRFAEFVPDIGIKNVGNNDTNGIINQIEWYPQSQSGSFRHWRYGTGGEDLMLYIERQFINNIIIRDNLPNNDDGKVTALRIYLEENNIYGIFELAVKNPNNKIIEPGDVTNDGENYYISYPLDYKIGGSAMINGVTLIDDGTRLVYPMAYNSNPVGKTLTYELDQPRLAEQYDLSTFKLTFDDDRIRILFDIDEGYYLWEITNNDILIPINGQHELGNTWTVKFYVYEIQQPLIRSLVLLIPLIVIGGLLYYLYIIVSKRE